VSTLKHDPDGIISLSDVDDEEINAMILNEEESRLKKVIWDNLNREWIKAQKQKRLLKKTIIKKEGGGTLGTKTNKERKISKHLDVSLLTIYIEQPVKIVADNPTEAIR
jgi:transcription factor IIIB subunit 2